MIAPTPTDAERAAAGRWLVRHRVDVPTMTDLLALRLGFRGGARPRGSWWWAAVAIVLVATAVTLLDLADNAYLFFVFTAFQLIAWVPVRVRDRQALALPGVRVFERRPGAGLGAWDVAALLVTFGGGAALGVTIFVTTSFRAYAGSWLVLLALGGVVTAVILTGILRRPVIAEDETSLAVDAAVRIEDAYFAVPAVYALLALFDAQPPGYGLWLIGYVAVALATQAVATFATRRRSRAILAAIPGEATETKQ